MFAMTSATQLRYNNNTNHNNYYARQNANAFILDELTGKCAKINFPFCNYTKPTLGEKEFTANIYNLCK